MYFAAKAEVVKKFLSNHELCPIEWWDKFFFTKTFNESEKKGLVLTRLTPPSDGFDLKIQTMQLLWKELYAHKLALYDQRKILFDGGAAPAMLF